MTPHRLRSPIHRTVTVLCSRVNNGRDQSPANAVSQAPLLRNPESGPGTKLNKILPPAPAKCDKIKASSRGILLAVALLILSSAWDERLLSADSEVKGGKPRKEGRQPGRQEKRCSGDTDQFLRGFVPSSSKAVAMAAACASSVVAGAAGLRTTQTGLGPCSTSKQGAVRFSSCVSLRGDCASLRMAGPSSAAAVAANQPFQVLAMAPPKPAGKAKKVVGLVKLALEAGKATPAPPVGPALGSKGVNIMAFCKEYNAKTADKPGYIIPVEITVFDDKSFTFILKTPPASVLLLKAAGVAKGSNSPQKEKVGKVTKDQVRIIAEEKLQDLNCTSIESAMRIIAGTAANMGIDIDPPILVKKEKVLY
ncbi:hypothetical protein Mapa_014483 [Marchantia paleacea]|nr:hypothetical protein Mapa_014483 [Marchantia paleacea]